MTEDEVQARDLRKWAVERAISMRGWSSSAAWQGAQRDPSAFDVVEAAATIEKYVIKGR